MPVRMYPAKQDQAPLPTSYFRTLSEGWFPEGVLSSSQGPPPRVKSHQSLNRFRRASTGGVPRGRGVRGAARGLERELKASGRHTKKHNNSIFRRDAPRISRPGKRRKKNSMVPFRNACHTRLEHIKHAGSEREKRLPECLMMIPHRRPCSQAQSPLQTGKSF